MPELAEIFRRYGQQYREKYKDTILPSQLRAMWDIENCRTETMGGHAYLCQDDSCGQYLYSYHSCKNRHCPKCQNDQAEIWLHQQRDKLLPVPHFLVTATLPLELRGIAYAKQRIIYNMLFKSSAAALQKLALDPRFIGGHIGMTGVMHTWNKTAGYHPHIHFLIPGGGLSPDHSRWLAAKEDFFIRVELISSIFRAKFRDALKKNGLFSLVPPALWRKNWVVHCEAVGSGKEAIIYLARYVFRVAITNNRIVELESDQVTFRCQDSKTKQWYLKKLPAITFIQRFLQHVLPKNFQKVRYYGIFSHTKRNLLQVVRYILRAPMRRPKPDNPGSGRLRCPKCNGSLRFIAKIQRASRGPPPPHFYQKKTIYC
jgi:hypothetical protein